VHGAGPAILEGFSPEADQLATAADVLEPRAHLGVKAQNRRQFGNPPADALNAAQKVIVGLRIPCGWSRHGMRDQRGVNSIGYLPGPYSEDAEASVMRFVDWYCGEAMHYLDRRALSNPRGSAGPRLAAVAGGS
jgi:hypothetical protein